MKKIFVIPILISLLTISVTGQNIETFNKYFIDETMRIDYYHIGDAKEEIHYT